MFGILADLGRWPRLRTPTLAPASRAAQPARVPAPPPADDARAKAVVKAATAAGLRLLTCGTYSNTARWISPVVVSAVEIDEGLGTLEGVLDRTAA